jgi:hypothetical protein
MGVNCLSWLSRTPTLCITALVAIAKSGGVTQGAIFGLVDDVPYYGKSGRSANVEFSAEFDP